MSKYNSNKIVIDGITFDSKIEGKYYEKLKQDKAKELIENFELQPEFTLIPKFEAHGKKYRPLIYRADFAVYKLDGAIEIIDIKGMATPEAKLKRKIFNYKENLKLIWLCWYQKQWIEYDELQKLRRDRKKMEG